MDGGSDDDSKLGHTLEKIGCCAGFSIKDEGVGNWRNSIQLKISNTTPTFFDSGHHPVLDKVECLFVHQCSTRVAGQHTFVLLTMEDLSHPHYTITTR